MGRSLAFLQKPDTGFEVSRSVDSAGGARTSRETSASIGGNVTLVGVAGNDVWAATLERRSRTSPISTPSSSVDFDRPTTVKTRYVRMDSKMLRADRECASAPSDDVQPGEFSSNSPTRCGHADVVVLSDYAKGRAFGARHAKPHNRGPRRGKPVIVDPGQGFGASTQAPRC